MALYDQLYATAARLYRNLNLNDHHYIPYQLAITFVSEEVSSPPFIYCENKNLSDIIYKQCVNQLGMYYSEYRERIQRKFDEIKSTLATNDSNKSNDSHMEEKLNEEQVIWLKQLTTDLMVQVLYGKDNMDPMKSNRYTLLTGAVVQAQKINKKEKATTAI